MLITRRKALFMLAAPAIVRAINIMPVRSLPQTVDLETGGLITPPVYQPLESFKGECILPSGLYSSFIRQGKIVEGRIVIEFDS